eukprot:1150842-Pelagomonas_calceolata.AAC.6
MPTAAGRALRRAEGGQPSPKTTTPLLSGPLKTSSWRPHRRCAHTSSAPSWPERRACLTTGCSVMRASVPQQTLAPHWLSPGLLQVCDLGVLVAGIQYTVSDAELQTQHAQRGTEKRKRLHVCGSPVLEGTLSRPSSADSCADDFKLFCSQTYQRQSPQQPEDPSMSRTDSAEDEEQHLSWSGFAGKLTVTISSFPWV